MDQSFAAPMVALEGWVRFGGASLVVLAWPGLLFLRSRLGRLGPVWSLALAVLLTLLFSPVYARLTGWLHLPYEAVGHVLAFSLAGWFVGGRAETRRWIDALIEPVVGGDRWGRWTLATGTALASGLLLATIAYGFRDYAAPPHIHDASNHAWLVHRILEVASTRLDDLYANAVPPAPYLVGWHGVAASLAQVSGLAPLPIAWYLPLLGTALVPVSLVLLWRHWGLPGLAGLAGAFLISANEVTPFQILWWGGFGKLLGLALAAVVALIVARGLRARDHLSVALAVLAIGSLANIHAEALLTAALLTLATLATPGHRPQTEGSRGAWIWLVVGVVVFSGWDLWTLARDYEGNRMVPPTQPRLEPMDALAEVGRVAGRDVHVVRLLVLGWGLALLRRSTRGIALVALGLATLYFLMLVVRDPVTMTVAKLFYQEASRVPGHLLPLVGALPLLPLGWLLARTRWPVLRLAVVVVAIGLTWVPWRVGNEGARAMMRGEWMRKTVPFSIQDHALAQAIPTIVPASETVANFWDDGSTWAMHISGRRFQDPASWPLLPPDSDLWPRSVTGGLLHTPWPPPTRALIDRGVVHVFASDTGWEEQRGAGPRARPALESDPRFCEVLRGPDSSLFRIHPETTSAAAGSGAGFLPGVEGVAGLKETTHWGHRVEGDTVRYRVQHADRARRLRVIVQGWESDRELVLTVSGADRPDARSTHPLDDAGWTLVDLDLPPTSSPGLDLELRFVGPFPPTGDRPRHVRRVSALTTTPCLVHPTRDVR